MLDDFDGDALDLSVWLPHYLPAWSSRAASRASYTVHDSCLDLFIPAEQGLWCADEHRPRLRVSGVQSGNHSGPVGSTIGQQPFRPGLTVVEEQETFWGWTPRFGRIEITARMWLSARSMASLWLVGREVTPEECAEICVFEIFGETVEVGAAAVGSGLHAFRDPRVPEDFATTQVEMDVTQSHTYAVEWSAESVTFDVDGVETRTCARPPTYPMQLMLAVFDFPDRATEAEREHVPRLLVDRVAA
jgi:hypothetical protein